MTDERGQHTATMVTENGSDTCLLVQGRLVFPDAVDALRKLSEGKPLDEIFPRAEKVDADRFQKAVIRTVEDVQTQRRACRFAGRGSDH